MNQTNTGNAMAAFGCIMLAVLAASGCEDEPVKRRESSRQVQFTKYELDGHDHIIYGNVSQGGDSGDWVMIHDPNCRRCCVK